MSPQMTTDLQNTREYLQSLQSVRVESEKLLKLAGEGKLKHFNVDISKLPEAAQYIIKLIERDYGMTDSANIKDTLNRIPPHGRWRHFGNDNVDSLIKELRGKNLDDNEVTRSLLDLFVVAVLLDAGAGDSWKFQDSISGKTFNRSEGLAVASLRMFQAGKFSSERDLKVDSLGLLNLTEEDLIEGFKVTDTNPLLGVRGRLELLHRLGQVLGKEAAFFPLQRPGSLLDYLITKQKGNLSLHINTLWEVVIKGFGGVWPESRTKLNNISLGDVWPCDARGGSLIPFHKLSQWLTYSLLEVLEKCAGLRFENVSDMTGLPEYRNGGFFVDLNVLKLRDADMEEGLAYAKSIDTTATVPLFAPDSQVIIEWRGLTVALIDRLANELRQELEVDADALPLAKILEAGTWKAGRELSKEKRPLTCGPPIAIISDGTLF